VNDGQYTHIRNYLEEIASKQAQQLAASESTNELLAQLLQAHIDGSMPAPAAARMPKPASKSKAGKEK
jgi:hypothetical protein